MQVLSSAGSIFQCLMAVNEKADCAKAVGRSGTCKSEFSAERLCSFASMVEEQHCELSCIPIELLKTERGFFSPKIQ